MSKYQRKEGYGCGKILIPVMFILLGSVIFALDTYSSMEVLQLDRLYDYCHWFDTYESKSYFDNCATINRTAANSTLEICEDCNNFKRLQDMSKEYLRKIHYFAVGFFPIAAIVLVLEILLKCTVNQTKCKKICEGCCLVSSCCRRVLSLLLFCLLVLYVTATFILPTETIGTECSWYEDMTYMPENCYQDIIETNYNEVICNMYLLFCYVIIISIITAILYSDEDIEDEAEPLCSVVIDKEVFPCKCKHKSTISSIISSVGDVEFTRPCVSTNTPYPHHSSSVNKTTFLPIHRHMYLPNMSESSSNRSEEHAIPPSYKSHVKAVPPSYRSCALSGSPLNRSRGNSQPPSYRSRAPSYMDTEPPSALHSSPISNYM